MSWPNPTAPWHLAPDQRAEAESPHAFVQTGTLVSFQHNNLTVVSSRGFGRDLAPTRPMRLPQKSRRYTIDVTVGPGTCQKLDFGVGLYSNEPEDLRVRSTTRAEYLGLEKIRLLSNETEEPVQRPCQLPPSDPLRYRQLHRWGHFLPPLNQDTYIRLGLGVRLTNEDLHDTITISGFECWYSDEVLEAAMYLLSQYYRTEANRIGLLGPAAVQSIRFIMLDNDMSGQREYIKQLEDKDYIFVPINSGMFATAYHETHGYHWALLTIDRRRLEAWYIDGFAATRRDREWQQLAWDLMTAVGKILGEEYTIWVAENPSDQYRDNFSDDAGPCGPYIIKMTKYYIQKILDFQKGGISHLIDLEPQHDVNQHFRQTFNSSDDRWCLVYTLASVKASQIASERALKHDEAAIGGPVSLLEPEEYIYDTAMFSTASLTHRQLTWRIQLQEEIRAQRSSSPISNLSVSPGVKKTTCIDGQGGRLVDVEEDEYGSHQQQVHNRVASHCGNSDDGNTMIIDLSDDEE